MKGPKTRAELVGKENERTGTTVVGGERVRMCVRSSDGEKETHRLAAMLERKKKGGFPAE